MHPSPDVLALLALGEEAGTPEEGEHVQTCAGCRAEIADLARAVAAGRSGRSSETGLVSPPDRVWHAIRAELGLPASPEESESGARGLPDVTPVTVLPQVARAETNGSTPDEPPGEGTPVGEVASLDAARTRSSRGRRGLALLVAAAVALVLGLGLGLGLDRILGPRHTTLWTAELQALPQFAGSTGEALVQEDADGNRTLLIELDSPEPVDGSREVWLIDSEVTKMRSLGYLLGNSGRFNIPADLDLKQFPLVDVSKEPPADPDIRHSGNSIVRGALDV